VFWVMTLCSVVVGYQRFGGPNCFHLQGKGWSWRQQRPPKHWHSTTTLVRKHLDTGTVTTLHFNFSILTLARPRSSKRAHFRSFPHQNLPLLMCYMSSP
jgi:hypothetical protein